MANNNYDFDAFGPDNSADETIHVGWITLQEFFILLAASLSPLCRCDDGWHPVACPNRVFPSSAVERLFVTGLLKGFDADHQDEALEDFDRVGILVTSGNGKSLLPLLSHAVGNLLVVCQEIIRLARNHPSLVVRRALYRRRDQGRGGDCFNGRPISIDPDAAPG
jgi:hypothetical protein